MGPEDSRAEPGNRESSRLTPSVAALVAANLFPLYGILFQGWQVFPVVLLFWLENVFIGIFFILRLLTLSPREPDVWIAKLFVVPFFAFHYGAFTAVHGTFVFALFGRGVGAFDGIADVGRVLGVVGKYQLTPAVVALALSHAFSFGWNYLGKGECHRASIGELMTRPYSRVVVLQLAIIGGGFLVMLLNSPVAGLLLLLALKISLDVKAHYREHRKAAAEAPGPGAR